MSSIAFGGILQRRSNKMDYLFFAISVIVIFTAGYKTAKKELKEDFRSKAEPMVVKAFHIGIQESLILIDKKLLEFGKKEGVEIPAYEFTVNGLWIKNVKEIPRKNNCKPEDKNAHL
jgi:hypothetical protein